MSRSRRDVCKKQRKDIAKHWRYGQQDTLAGSIILMRDRSASATVKRKGREVRSARSSSQIGRRHLSRLVMLRRCSFSPEFIRYIQLERHEDALEDTEESLRLYPASFKALRTRARINLHLEKYDASIADFKSAIEQAEYDGNNADVRALKGELKKAELALKRSKTKDYYKILGEL